MSFQKITMTIAIIFLVLMLAMIAVLLYNSASSLQFPPDIAECPDYWEVIGDKVCKNVQNLGNGTCGSQKSFSGAEWQGNAGIKHKNAWAKSCGITWDGVTNNSINTSS